MSKSKSRLNKQDRLIREASIPLAQRQRFNHEVVEVSNPLGEVVIKGEVRRHRAVRRVPHFETLYRTNVLDRKVFIMLEWYDARLAMAESGLIKCGIDVSGAGGGSSQSHIPINLAAMEARSDLDQARSCIPADLLPVFDGVMVDGETFSKVGRRVYPSISADRASRKASSAFKIAANYLLAGMGGRIAVTNQQH